MADAIGFRVRARPLTPERVLDAVKEKERAEQGTPSERVARPA